MDLIITIWSLVLLALCTALIIRTGIKIRNSEKVKHSFNFIYTCPELKVKYFTDKIDKLKFVEGKSDWMDLHAAEDVELKAGDFKLIPLGIAMELPEGFEAHVIPRSSTFKNYGILQANSMGLIDESYCGDNDQWFMPVYATRDTIIHQNDRICQFRLMGHQVSLEITEVEHLEGKDRGGFGSTGV